MHRFVNRFAATAVYAACLIGSAFSETFIYAKPIAGDPISQWEFIETGSPAFLIPERLRLETLINGALNGNYLFEITSGWFNGRQITNWSTYGTTYEGLAGQFSSRPYGSVIDYPYWTQLDAYLPEQIATITMLRIAGTTGFTYRIDTMQSSADWAERIRIEWVALFAGLALFPLLLKLKLPTQPKVSQEERLRYALERAQSKHDYSSATYLL